MLDSLKSLPIHFTTLDGEKLEIALDEVISPQSRKVIKGKGMAIMDWDPLSALRGDFQRGDLIVKFDIQFPRELSEE